jgi:uncharacterized protein YbjT (DUF2867 family)
MTSSDVTLVTAASGKTGMKCVEALLARGARVRGLVRREDAAAQLRSMGAEAFVGDLFDSATTAAAMTGARVIVHICPPMHPLEDELAATLINQAAHAGVARFVLYSVLHPHIAVPHHRRKLKAEQTLIDSGVPFTILQPCRYMHHLEAIWREVLASGVHRMPFSTTTRFNLVHLRDLAEATAIVATDDAHADAIYELAGPQALSQDDCARTISEALGRKVVAQARPLEDFLEKARAAGMPAARLEVFDIMNRHYDAHGLQGNGNVLRWLLGRAPVTFADYVRTLPAT